MTVPRSAGSIHHIDGTVRDSARSTEFYDRVLPVDRMHDELVRLGVVILDAPALYERYGRGYYALFFADPDGIKLEYVFTPEWPVG